MDLRTTDYHTAGEPFRIVTAGVPEIPGSDVRARREAAMGSDEVETVRRLRTDDRVTVIERTNARSLRPEDLPYAPDLIVADVSFISLAKVLPALR